ncbi:metallophosphoesterase family protein [Daejeonella sp. JGW-45]|uniref:metallophosphoesterase family protein n=1 Tax=Daejeonella sp. JGW-45 TaxID=3034148 RepID=UPI0023EC4C3B|nr:metallophosphoesterase family protein [Daejeonella sp. JGW-45]
MKIALFSDIHANLPAFEAFLADLDARKADAVYCLGDLIGYHIWPNEIIDEVRKRGISTLAGNHDLKLADLDACDEKNYAYTLVTRSNRDYLLSLPAIIELQFKSIGKVLLAHGSPQKVDEYVLEDTAEEYVMELMGEATILCVGHSHKPYYRVIDNGKRHVINIGSVGKPKDGDPRGCYVVLTIPTPQEAEIGVEFIRFEYDVGKAAMAIEDSLLPRDLADRLRKGY